MRQRSAYDLKTAIFLAAVSGQTYTQFENADGSFVVPQGYRLVEAFKGLSFHGVQEWFGFLLESDDRLVLAFRGTSSTADWMANAMARQVKYKYVKDAGWTHRGFTQIYSSMRAQVLSALNRMPAHKPLYVTGHSLGGALAALCSIDVAANTAFTAPRLYTYGSPRVGDPGFARCFAGSVPSSYRIANKNDVVPHLPPAVFKIPQDDTVYYYMQVREAQPLQFQDDSLVENHVIAQYFEHLASLDPAYAKSMCAANPGFCP